MLAPWMPCWGWQLTLPRYPAILQKTLPTVLMMGKTNLVKSSVKAKSL